MKIYLASPLFTEFEKEMVKRRANLLRSLGAEVYVPMEHQIKDAYELPNYAWARAVFEEDVKAIRECDVVVCLYYGLYSDSGTAWECGFAYGIGKRVELINMCGKEASLMMVNCAFNSEDFKDKNQT